MLGVPRGHRVHLTACEEWSWGCTVWDSRVGGCSELLSNPSPPPTLITSNIKQSTRMNNERKQVSHVIKTDCNTPRLPTVGHGDRSGTGGSGGLRVRPSYFCIREGRGYLTHSRAVMEEHLEKKQTERIGLTCA